jgi:hypothetical protein
MRPLAAFLAADLLYSAQKFANLIKGRLHATFRTSSAGLRLHPKSRRFHRNPAVHPAAKAGT